MLCYQSVPSRTIVKVPNSTAAGALHLLRQAERCCTNAEVVPLVEHHVLMPQATRWSSHLPPSAVTGCNGTPVSLSRAVRASCTPSQRHLSHHNISASAVHGRAFPLYGRAHGREVSVFAADTTQERLASLRTMLRSQRRDRTLDTAISNVRALVLRATSGVRPCTTAHGQDGNDLP